MKHLFPRLLALASVTTLMAASLTIERFNSASASVAGRRPAESMGQRSTLIAGLGFTVQNIRPSRQRVGGISRGSGCLAANATPSLTAILPQLPSTNRNQIDVESTISERPTFFAYIPPTTAQSASFLLTNDSGDVFLHEVEIPLTRQPGIVAVTLPSNLGLDVGATYHWSVALQCDPNDPSSNIFTEGYVRLEAVDADLRQEIERAAPRDRPALYARAGIWQDTLTTLAKLRYENPRDPKVNADWASLLTSVNLAPLANAPIVQWVGDSPN